MNIFEFTDYKAFLNSWVEALPKGGRGEYRRLALKLGISTTMISQVFKGDKHLSLELASDLCDYLNLSEKETEYFFLLVEYARAGNFRLQQKLLRRIKTTKLEMQKLEARIKTDKELSDDTKQIFYSSWIYSAARHIASLPQINDAAAISERLQISMPQIQRVLEFLIKEGLVIQREGKLELGPRKTHIGAQAPMVARHHQNWRILAFQKMAMANEENLFFTSPMSLSESVAQKIREELPAFIEKLANSVVPSPCETTRCLNIDWFEF